MGPKVTHIVLACRSLGEAKRFYIDTLGCELRVERPDFLGVLAGELILNFVEGEVAGTDTIKHIGVELPKREDVERLYDALSYAGYRISTKRENLRRSDQSGPYRFYVRDPTGYQVEVSTWSDT